MDRRQKKSREAIIWAFIDLLSKKNYNRISVQEIIDAADVGRSTFYAHFETKDDLLRELCEGISDHMIETAHGHFTDEHKNVGHSLFLHLLIHIRENNQSILSLLSSPNNEIFLRYFKNSMKKMLREQYTDAVSGQNPGLPEDYIVDYISGVFVETVHWWISRKMKESPETIEGYFKAVLPAFLQYE